MGLLNTWTVRRIIDLSGNNIAYIAPHPLAVHKQYLFIPHFKFFSMAKINYNKLRDVVLPRQKLFLAGFGGQ